MEMNYSRRCCSNTRHRKNYRDQSGNGVGYRYLRNHIRKNFKMVWARANDCRVQVANEDLRLDLPDRRKPGEL